jgi:hypothetical protein
MIVAIGGTALAQTYFGPNGQYEGRAVPAPNGGMSFWGPHGEYEGREIPNTNGRTYWGPYGQYQGREIAPPTLISPTLPSDGNDNSAAPDSDDTD